MAAVGDYNLPIVHLCAHCRPDDNGRVVLATHHDLWWNNYGTQSPVGKSVVWSGRRGESSPNDLGVGGI